MKTHKQLLLEIESRLARGYSTHAEALEEAFALGMKAMTNPNIHFYICERCGWSSAAYIEDQYPNIHSVDWDSDCDLAIVKSVTES